MTPKRDITIAIFVATIGAAFAFWPAFVNSLSSVVEQHYKTIHIGQDSVQFKCREVNNIYPARLHGPFKCTHIHTSHAIEVSNCTCNAEKTPEVLYGQICSAGSNQEWPLLAYTLDRHPLHSRILLVHNATQHITTIVCMPDSYSVGYAFSIPRIRMDELLMERIAGMNVSQIAQHAFDTRVGPIEGSLPCSERSFRCAALLLLLFLFASMWAALILILFIATPVFASLGCGCITVCFALAYAVVNHFDLPEQGWDF